MGIYIVDSLGYPYYKVGGSVEGVVPLEACWTKVVLVHVNSRDLHQGLYRMIQSSLNKFHLKCLPIQV